MASPTLAGPPGKCCTMGVKHEGVPAGKVVEIAGVPTYISEPTNPQTDGKPRKILLYYSDIWGTMFNNNQLLQDYFADNGYLVLGIDYFFGDAVRFYLTEPGFDILKWADENMERALEVAPKWLNMVRKTYGDDAQYFAVGYCFGAPFVNELAKTEFIRAAAFAHPAFLNEDHFKNLSKPLLLSLAEDDNLFPPEARRRAEDLLVADKSTYYIQVFGGVSHGFAIRGDMSNENERWAKEESARSILGWFNRFAD